MDFDGDAKPIDIPGINNNFFGAAVVYDAGVNEYNVTDIIFINFLE